MIGSPHPCVFDGPINGAAFKAWIDQAVAPTLHAGDIVILDNLSSHKVAGIKQAIESRGRTRCGGVAGGGHQRFSGKVGL